MTDASGRTDLESVRMCAVSSDGSFAMPVMPGVTYLLDIRQKGQWIEVYGEHFGTFEAPRNDIALTLGPEDFPATSFVEGRVVDGGGAAVLRASFDISDGKSRANVDQNTLGTTSPDAAGRFRIGPLPARAYVLYVAPEDSALPEFETPRFQLKPNQTLDLGDVAPGAACRLSIRLRRQDGGVFPEAIVQLAAEGEPKQGFPFDAKGNFEQNLKPGKYTMTVSGSHCLAMQQQLELAKDEHRQLELVLPAGIIFWLRLPPPPGETEGSVTVRGDEGKVEAFIDIFPSLVATEWRWQPCLTPGAHTAELTCGSGKCYRASFSVFEQPVEPGKRPTPSEILWTPVR